MCQLIISRRSRNWLFWGWCIGVLDAGLTEGGMECGGYGVWWSMECGYVGSVGAHQVDVDVAFNAENNCNGRLAVEEGRM
jgi:hypothetical protein